MTDPIDSEHLAPGLYLVATPIGNARDITLRALDILKAAEVLAAEDTRSLRRLMEIHGIPLAGRHVVAYHDHNGPAARPKLLAALAQGKSVAYASEAGTPLVSDPGFGLVREAIVAEQRVFSAPGASAALAALVVAGLPSDRFTFVGFAPTSSSARKKFLTDLSGIDGTLILYEAPRRLAAFLDDACEVLGAEREAVVCRELTKRFEEVRRGTLAGLGTSISDMPIKGEVVVCIGPPAASDANEDDIAAAMKREMQDVPLKEAAKRVSDALGVGRRDAYQIGLSLKDGK